ncbi:MAG: hypothetical protein M1819_004990 [Sarea resinae]|nr:MAG: hypothetical protein M1819_004990 [Sarea resinae]
MSFINSVLSSIGSGGRYAPQSPASRPPSAPTAKPDAPAPNSSGPSQNSTRDTSVVSVGQKRKAEEELPRAAEKAARKDLSPSARPGPPRNRFQSSTPASNSTSSTAAVPLRLGAPGAVKPVGSSSSVAPSAAAAASSSKPPPKKGSYAEILARAKAAQTSSAVIGAIKHKPVEKLSKSQKLAKQAEASKPKRGATDQDRRDGRNGKATTPIGPGRDSKDPPIKKKQPLDVGYKGTARPKSEDPGYKGTMNRSRPNLQGQKRDRDSNSRSRSTSLARPGPSGAPSRNRYRYASYSDEEEGEDVDDYDSEGSSDMEAAPFELEEEEQLSLRNAKKEDELAQKEEEEHRRAKEEKRKMLAKMALSRKK